MNKILIISIILLLMLTFNRKEYFTVPTSEELPDLKCENNSKQLGIANMYADEVCQDNQVIGRYINNQRIDCRNFVERQIIIGNDNKQICAPDNKIPIMSANAPLNSFENIQDTGINTTENNESTDNYPFELNQVNVDLVNLDNKQV